MENIIKVEMEDNRDIVIYCDSEKKITIPNDNRIINAKDLFEIFKNFNDKTIKVTKINTSKKDEAVLDFFTELIENISNEYNKYNEEKC